MFYDAVPDPHCYPGTTVLKNRSSVDLVLPLGSESLELSIRKRIEDRDTCPDYIRDVSRDERQPVDLGRRGQ